MAEEKKPLSRHKIVVDQRRSAVVSGVSEVISFDEETAVAETDLGVIVIRGAGLHVDGVDLDGGLLELEGDIESITYEDRGRFLKGRGGFLKKILR